MKKMFCAYYSFIMRRVPKMKLKFILNFAE